MWCLILWMGALVLISYSSWPKLVGIWKNQWLKLSSPDRQSDFGQWLRQLEVFLSMNGQSLRKFTQFLSPHILSLMTSLETAHELQARIRFHIIITVSTSLFLRLVLTRDLAEDINLGFDSVDYFSPILCAISYFSIVSPIKRPWYLHEKKHTNFSTEMKKIIFAVYGYDVPNMSTSWQKKFKYLHAKEIEAGVFLKDEKEQVLHQAIVDFTQSDKKKQEFWSEMVPVFEFVLLSVLVSLILGEVLTSSFSLA